MARSSTGESEGVPSGKSSAIKRKNPRKRLVALSPERGRSSATVSSTDADNATRIDTEVITNPPSRNISPLTKPSHSPKNQRDHTSTHATPTRTPPPLQPEDPRKRLVALSPERGRSSATVSSTDADNATRIDTEVNSLKSVPKPPGYTNLRFLYSNATSLVNKWDEFKTLIKSTHKSTGTALSTHCAKQAKR